MNCLNNMQRIILTNDLVMDMIRLYQFKGKDFYYEDITHKDLDHMIKDTIERDTFFFARILNLKISENKMRLIIKKGSTPSTKDENVLANLKKIFRIIQDKIVDFELIVNEIHDLGKLLFKNVKIISFNSTTIITDSVIHKQKVSKREDLEKLLEAYIKKSRAKEHELTTIITSFYIDFLNLNIFNAENETIGLLLLYILLFKERFNLFRYISFFEYLFESKDSFDKGVLQANFNWDDGFSQTMPLNRTIINLMLKGYDKIELMIRDYEFDNKLNKSDNIENSIMRFGEIFTKDEIRNLHPYVSESTINRTLQRLTDENKIRSNGKGRSATWVKLISFDQFDLNIKQTSLFDLLNDDEYE